MKYAQQSFLIIIFIWSLLSCKKSNKNNSDNLKSEYLAQKAWVLKDAKQKNEFTGQWDNTYSIMQTCSSDNIVSYTNSGTYSIDEGPTKCYPIDAQIMHTGIWTFNNNATQLILDSFYKKEILVLNEDTLKYTEIGPQGWGTYEAEFTYTH